MFGDVKNLQQRQHPLKIPHLVERITGLPLKAKSFRNIATHQKLKGGGGSINPHSPYLVHNCGGMTLRVRPRVKTPVNAKRILINTAITLLWL